MVGGPFDVRLDESSGWQNPCTPAVRKREPTHDSTDVTEPSKPAL